MDKNKVDKTTSEQLAELREARKEIEERFESTARAFEASCSFVGTGSEWLELAGERLSRSAREATEQPALDEFNAAEVSARAGLIETC